ncbi:MAG: hypothetical protein ACE5FA_04140 [Dehalococcoidia bacterium]
MATIFAVHAMPDDAACDLAEIREMIHALTRDGGGARAASIRSIPRVYADLLEAAERFLLAPQMARRENALRTAIENARAAQGKT